MRRRKFLTTTVVGGVAAIGAPAFLRSAYARLEFDSAA
jgi:hypothetical protein